MTWSTLVVLVGSLVLSVLGLPLFIRTALSLRRKVLWTGFLMGAGAAAGSVLPSDRLALVFLIAVAIVPLLALVDLRVSSSNRDFFYWVRACSFEVGTVFGTAATVSYLLDHFRRAA